MKFEAHDLNNYKYFLQAIDEKKPIKRNLLTLPSATSRKNYEKNLNKIYFIVDC